MTLWIVTVKLEKLEEHYPKAKITGGCRLNMHTECTDKTGEHHSFLHTDNYLKSADEVKRFFSKTYHVTRVERV